MSKYALSKKVVAAGSSWILLGFYRGTKEYNYNNKQLQKPAPYMYSDAFTIGLLGALYYANPFLLPFTVSKEIYRLEVNIRDMEAEKKSLKYNRI